MTCFAFFIRPEFVFCSMKRNLLYTLLACILFASKLTAQTAGEPATGSKPITGSKPTPGEKKGWASSERYSFIKECINEAKGGMSEDSARFYCYCMQERMEKKYPTVDEVAKLTEEDMQSPAFQKDIEECFGGTWGTEDRETFLDECVKTATTTVGAEKAQSYCECMLFKIEKAFPIATEAFKHLTPERLNTTEWKKIVQGCRDF
jgi:hypothetical protein